MIIILLYKILLQRDSLKSFKIFIPLAIYSVFSLLSTVISSYSSYGYSGILEQFESVFVLISYCVIAFYAYLIINTENDIKFIIKYFSIGIAIIILIGLTQAIGYDFYTTEIGKNLILSRSTRAYGDGFSFNLGKYRVYSSLFNPNYVGVYAALVVPILLTLLFFTKKIKSFIYFFSLLIGLLICLFGSESRSGFIGIIISILFLLIIIRKKLMKNWKVVISILACGLCVFFIINHLNNNTLISKFTNLFQTSKIEKSLTSITTYDDKVSIEYKNNTLNIELITNNGQFVDFLLTDDNNNIVVSKIDNSNLLYTITDTRFTGVTIQPIVYDGMLSFQFKVDSFGGYFTNQTGDNTYYFINIYGKLDKIYPAKSALFKGYETFASGRGFIWSRTLPLLKDHIFFGSGADSFVFAFPQNDYIGLFNYGFYEQLITKPHNMYLQTGVQTGLISLMSILVFFLIYFISSFKLYFKSNFNTFTSQVGLAIFIGTISYMISGLSNDSTICVAPIFWALIGVGIAINTIVKKEIQKVL
jgi:O-antigen ligase